MAHFSPPVVTTLATRLAGGTEEDAGIIAISEKTVSGVSQKGPFVNGSSVTVQELDGETLSQTGNSFEGKIRNDMGEFSVKVSRLESQYVLLRANGFYRNEVTGEKSNSPVTLYAFSDLSNRDEVNVNLLTHLAYERSLYLATGREPLPVATAKRQAEGEVFSSFAIEGKFDAAEDLNIFGESDQSAALLAMSVLMQGDLKEADFSERLDNYARDIETDGKWDDAATAARIADWAAGQGLGAGLAAIRSHIAGWNLSSGVPPFEKYMNNFWWQNYGLGVCDTKREGEVLQATNALSANNGVHFICNGGVWRKATDIEKDTYMWVDPAKNPATRTATSNTATWSRRTATYMKMTFGVAAMQAIAPLNCGAAQNSVRIRWAWAATIPGTNACRKSGEQQLTSRKIRLPGVRENLMAKSVRGR